MPKGPYPECQTLAAVLLVHYVHLSYFILIIRYHKTDSVDTRPTDHMTFSPSTSLIRYSGILLADRSWMFQ